MAVDDVREENRREWRAWADRNPDKALEGALARQKRMQDATAGGARNGEPWTEEDYQLLMNFSRPLLDVALELGRTYKACVQARRRRMKLLDLEAVYAKSETDPYDGADRKPRIEATQPGGFFDERTA